MSGYVLILPGIMNVTFHLVWVKRAISHAYPFYHVQTARWGTPLGWIGNLLARERNRRAAESISQKLASYRQNHPDAAIHVIGYSGGGGLAVMAAASLPRSVTINRLLVIAPAISPGFPLVEQVLPHVSEFMVNYASTYDIQIAQGTRILGNIDGPREPGAGASGFTIENAKLIQVHWHKRMIRYGHLGNHISYLSPPWQQRYVLPALDPGMTAEALRGRLT